MILISVIYLLCLFAIIKEKKKKHSLQEAADFMRSYSKWLLIGLKSWNKHMKNLSFYKIKKAVTNGSIAFRLCSWKVFTFNMWESEIWIQDIIIFVRFDGNTKNGVVTWTGLDAIRTPPTPPPMTRPSGLARDTLSPPVLLREPPLSVTKYEPDRHTISKRPYQIKSPPAIKYTYGDKLIIV